MIRTAKIERNTNETRISLMVNLDGSGNLRCRSGIGFLDHMMDHLARHSMTDIEITAEGDLEVDDHHTVEDIAICLGQAFRSALGDKAGIRRYGWAMAPMDETLAQAAVDLSGRAWFVMNAPFSSDKIGSFDTQLIEEFLQKFAASMQANMHINVPYGSNDHHIAEAIFKAVAMALRMAKSHDEQRGSEIASTKGSI